MSSISSLFLPKSEDLKERQLFEAINKMYIELKTILNGGIRFDDNFDACMVTFTTSTADAQVEVTHTLGKVPAGYIVYAQDKAGSLYTSTGGTAWSTTKLYLKCSIASVTFKIIVF